MIPGYNDSDENISATVRFLDPLKQVKGLDLLPFNVFPVAKYNALGDEWDKYKGLKTQSDEYIEKLCKLVQSHSSRIRCTIGGLW